MSEQNEEQQEAEVLSEPTNDLGFEETTTDKEDLALMMNVGGAKPEAEEEEAPAGDVSENSDDAASDEDEQLEEQQKPDDEPSELEKLRAELAALKESLTKEPEKKEEAVVVPALEAKEGVFQLFGDDITPYDLTSTPEGLNLLGTKVINASVEMALRHAMPVIQAETARIQAIYSFSTEFYRANPDLRADAATVSAVVEELVRENEAIKPKELFEKAGAEARKRLRLPDPKAAPTKASKPAGVASASAAVAGASMATSDTSLKDDLRAMARAK